MMTKTTICASVLSIVFASGALALAQTPSVQNHHCKLPDGSIDLKKTHKACDTAKGEWAADTAKPSTPVAPSAPATSTKSAVKPSGDNTQDHHCRMPDKSIDLKKTHKECEVAKGEWAKNDSKATTPATATQDHHCRMPDKTMDLKKTHKECEAAKGEWAMDASKPAVAPHAP